MTPWRYSSSSIYHASRRSTRSKSGIGNRAASIECVTHSGLGPLTRIDAQTAIPFLVGTKVRYNASVDVAGVESFAQFDAFCNFAQDEQDEITRQAKRFSKAMRAPLIYCSCSHSINVQKVRLRPLFSAAMMPSSTQIFKIVLSKVRWFAYSVDCRGFAAAQAFDLKCTIQEITEPGEPLLMCAHRFHYRV